MLIDAESVLMEDEAFAANVAKGAIDLYSAAIPVYPNSNLSEVNARGQGSPLVITGVIKRGGTGTTAFSGTATATVYVDDTDGDTTAVAVHTIACTDAKHDGVVFNIEVPRHVEGRYLGLAVNDASVVGGGDANVVDAFVFAQ